MPPAGRGHRAGKRAARPGAARAREPTQGQLRHGNCYVTRITKSQHLFLNFDYTSELYRGLMQTNYFRGIVNNINYIMSILLQTKGSNPMLLYYY